METPKSTYQAEIGYDGLDFIRNMMTMRMSDYFGNITYYKIDERTKELLTPFKPIKAYEPF